MNKYSDNIFIRPIGSEEIMLLTDFLYEAIYQPDGSPRVPRTVLQDPMIWAYIKDFGIIYSRLVPYSAAPWSRASRSLPPRRLAIAPLRRLRLAITRPKQIVPKDFGKHPGDLCFVAVSDSVIVGAAWSRIGCSYGKVDENTPKLAISIYPEYRRKGIGSRLLSTLLDNLAANDYHQVSLSVDKANFAVRLYRKLGFEAIEEREHDYLMLKRLEITEAQAEM